MSDWPRILLFDVNETVLDLTALDPLFTEVFGQADVRREWFETAIRGVLLSTTLNRHHSFGEIGEAALEETTRRHGRTLPATMIDHLRDGMRTLPPHPVGGRHFAAFRMPVSP